MATNVLTDIKDYLEGLAITDTIPAAWGAVLVFNTNLFIGQEPSSPISCITLNPTGGYASDVNRKTENPTVQVRIRNESFQTGYSAGYEIAQDFHERDNLLVNTSSKCFAIQSQPIYLGKNESDRGHAFTINFMFRLVGY